MVYPTSGLQVGSVIAFGSYFTLLGNIGPDRAAYVSIIVPIIALAVSTVYEDYHWTVIALAGVAIITMGNIMILRKKPAVPDCRILVDPLNETVAAT